MKHYKFTVTAELVITAETPELAEKYLRESLNPQGEMFNVEVRGHEIGQPYDPSMSVSEEYEVKIQC